PFTLLCGVGRILVFGNSPRDLGNSPRDFGNSRRKFRRRNFGCKLAAVEELQAAPAAVEQAAAAGHPLQQIEKTGMFAVDTVRRLQPDHAVGAAERAAAGGAEMVAEPARSILLAPACGAHINCHINEALEEA